MFLLEEDAALKELLEGMTVSDYASGQDARPVAVRYSMPDKEPADRDFPFVVVSMVSIRKSTFREMRGIYPFSADTYYPTDEEYDEYRPGGAREGEIVWGDWPIPHDIYYMITPYSRYDLHDRQIQSQLIRRVPYRGGWVPVNNTVRLLELLSVQSGDFKEGQKRTFRKNYMVRLESELSEQIVYRKTAEIENVDLTTKWGLDVDNPTNTETSSF